MEHESNFQFSDSSTFQFPAVLICLSDHHRQQASKQQPQPHASITPHHNSNIQQSAPSRHGDQIVVAAQIDTAHRTSDGDPADGGTEERTTQWRRGYKDDELDGENFASCVRMSWRCYDWEPNRFSSYGERNSRRWEFVDQGIHLLECVFNENPPKT